jgi:hypothetical protein
MALAQTQSSICRVTMPCHTLNQPLRPSSNTTRNALRRFLPKPRIMSTAVMLPLAKVHIHSPRHSVSANYTNQPTNQPTKLSAASKSCMRAIAGQTCTSCGRPEHRRAMAGRSDGSLDSLREISNASNATDRIYSIESECSSLVSSQALWHRNRYGHWFVDTSDANFDPSLASLTIAVLCVATYQLKPITITITVPIPSIPSAVD